MKNRKFQIGVAIFVAPLIVLGLVFSIVANDQTTLVMTLVMAAVYAFYLIKLIPVLKNEKEQGGAKQASPLQRRR